MFDKTRSWIKENKQKAIVLGIVGFIVFCFAQYEFIHFSSSPTFCRNLCHTMEVDVAAWEVSSHGMRGTDCVSCHFEEGLVGYMTAKTLAMVDLLNTITGVQGHHIDHNETQTAMLQKTKKYRGMELLMLPQYKRHPSIDPSMVSTHADEEGWWAIMPTRGTYLRNNIVVNCTNCHSKRGNRGVVSPKRTADFIVRNQLLEFTGKVEKLRKGIVIPHAIHLDKGFNCLDCHAEIVHGPIEMKDANGVIMPRMVICFQCHNDKRAPRECPLCHKQQLRMNLGIEGIGVEDSPNYMYPDNAVCRDCHLEENNYKMTAKVCAEECHEEGYDDTLHEWQSQTVALLKKLEPQILAVEKNIVAATDAGRNVGPALELFSDANYNFQFVKNDGSRGGHNVDYAESLLGIAQEKIEMARDLLSQ